MEYIIEEISSSNNSNIQDNHKAIIKVIGVGGAGTNMIDHMIRTGTFDVDIFVTNTDAQHLNHSLSKNKLQLGQKLTKGLGAGSKPEIGKEAALESYEDIKEMIQDANLVFISAGMGGGTGTGAAPIIAQATKELGALAIGVVSLPFNYEGKRRKKKALTGLAELQEICDQVIVVENEKLPQTLEKNTGFKDSYKLIDDILYKAVHGVSGIILTDGNGTNVDFADVNTVMSYRGQALMGIGEAKGDDAAREAVRNALTHPLMDNITIDDAQGLLAYFQFHEDYPSVQMLDAFGMISDILDEDASDPIFGHTYDNNLDIDEVRVTIVATGIGEDIGIYSVEEKTTQVKVENIQSKQIEELESLQVAVPSIQQTVDTYKVHTIPQNSEDDEYDYPSYWKKKR